MENEIRYYLGQIKKAMAEPTEVRRAMPRSIFNNLPTKTPNKIVPTTTMASMMMAGSPTAVIS